MIYGIMQPYFFPYVGYFSLIEYSDSFIFFDTVQYISKGWINRNRIIGVDKKPTYITVPIKKMPQSTHIKEAQINNGIDWKQSLWGQLTVYKKRAPKYNDTIDFLHYILDKKEYSHISELNIDSTVNICERLGFQTHFDTFSKMNLNIESVNAPDEWALNITKALGGEVYVNPPGGKAFFDREKYENNGINLQFLSSNLKPYVQRIGHFEPGLSIIDVMMFCSDDEIKDIIRDFRIE